MKIKKIYILAFGGLKDFTLELGDNMNVIFGENENGKTTVMAFIKAMFYGTGKNTRSANGNVRSKYTPFDGSAMGGRIYFENSNKTFILERQFLKSDSTDKIMLTNIDTGESVTVPSDIGTKLFGMGAEAFSNSLFIAGELPASKTDEAVGELNAKLSNVALTGDENASYQKIEGNIEKTKEKILSKSGRAGLLYKAKNELESLNERYDNAKKDAVRKCEINNRINELITSGKKLSAQYSKCKAITDAKDDIKNAFKLKEYLSLKEKLDALNETLKTNSGKILDSQFVSKIKFIVGRVEAQREKCAEIEKDIEQINKATELEGSMTAEETEKKLEETKKLLLNLDDEKERINREIEKLEVELSAVNESMEAEMSSKKPPNTVLLILGAVFALCGIASGIFVNIMFFIASAFGILLFALGFVIKPSNEKKILEIKEKSTDIKQKIAEQKNNSAVNAEKITTLTGNMNMLLSIIGADKTVKEQRATELKQKTERLEEENEKLNALLKEQDTALDGEIIDAEKLNIMEKNAEAQKDIKLKLNYLSKDLGGISYEDARKKLESSGSDSSLTDSDFENAEKQKEELGEKMTSIREDITALETELKTSFRNSEQPELLEREISLLLDKIKRYSDFVDASNVAIEVLEESFANVRRGYGGALSEETLKIFGRLTNGRYSAVSVSQSFEIMAEQKDIFGMHEIGYLSQGTIDQALLSLKLAIAKLIGDKESLPIMLDDALSNYDDKRTDEAIKTLKEYSLNSQVLLFTCHNSVVDSAKQNGINTVNLK